VGRVSATRVTELVEFDFALHKLLVLAAPVVYALALLAGEFDKLVL